MEHIFVVGKTPDTTCSFGTISKKFEPKIITDSKGQEITKYNLYLQVYGGHQFIEKNSYNYTAPTDAKTLTLLFSVSENIYDKLREGQTIIVKGEIEPYKGSKDDVRFKINTKEVVFDFFRTIEGTNTYNNTTNEINGVAAKPQYNKYSSTRSSIRAARIQTPIKDKNFDVNMENQLTDEEAPFDTSNEISKDIHNEENIAQTEQPPVVTKPSRRRSSKTSSDSRDTVFINKAL